MEEGQTPDSMKRDQDFNQKLLMFCFQWQSKAIDYTVRERRHTVTIHTNML